MQKIITVKRPIANIISTASRGLAVTAINGYQKFISPYKGFACAHRVLYGCESCSQYFKHVIAEEGIFIAIANSKARFQECHEANEILKKRRAKCKSRREYYASRLRSNTVAIESGEPEQPDIPEDTEKDQQNNQKLGGAQWQRKPRSQVNNSNNNKTNNNCNDCADCSNCNIDPSDCFGWRNSDHSSDASECPDLSFPDLSCPDLSCGSTDCFSGMDCSGLDCSGVGDCGSCS